MEDKRKLPPRSRWDREIDAAIVILSRDPHRTVKSVAEELGITRQTLEYHIKRRGIDERPV